MIKIISILLISVSTWLPIKKEKKYDYNIKSTEVSVENLSKKWLLNNYKVFFRSYPIAENEKADYIQFNKDMTFSSISEGIYDTGKWRLDKKSKRIFMTNPDEEGELILIIKKLSKEKLIVVIDDPNDSDAKYLSIIFKVQK